VTEAHRSRATWLVTAAAVLAVGALAFGIGRFTAFGASAAPQHPATDSADAGFARDMQVHHAQAVEMAMEIYAKTSDDELRALSYDIATAQSAQRGEMYGWLVTWGLPQAGGPLMGWMGSGSSHEHGEDAASEADLRAQMGMATDAELAELRADTGTAADCLFLALMVRHHEGAIPMAEAVIDEGSDARVRAVATSMVQTQSAEIDAMTGMQQRLACG
jgi:uncharacterized protein (DUF305 family)